MIRAIRPAAVARDDASLITGWNIAPNVGYTVTLSVSASAVVVILASADGSKLIGSGVALVGTDQPVTITPVTGQAISMVDADLGWHLLVTTAGTEGERSITFDPMVDLADEIHPIYTDDNMALARATAAIDAASHYIDDVTVTCPLGIGAVLEDVVSVPVDGSAVIGQVESITWSGTPDGSTAQAVIRRHTPIAPEAYTPPPAPPVLADDTAETDAATTTSGNVLSNDTGVLTVSAVNGLSATVGQVVTGSTGGDFVINADGSWTFDPSGDFAALSGSDTATTSVTYHASDGVIEAMGTLTVTVSASDAPTGDPYWDDVVLCINAQGDDGSTTITDEKGATITRYGNTQVDDSLGYPTILFDGSGDYFILPTGANFNFGTSDFTVEFFVRIPGGTTQRDIISKFTTWATNVDFRIYTEATSRRMTFWAGDISNHININSDNALPADAMTHVAICRESGVTRMFIDGSLQASTHSGAVNIPNDRTTLTVGYATGGQYMLGHIRAIRITAAARYSSSFTPPDVPFPTS